MKIKPSTLKLPSQFAICILILLGLVELALAIWTVAENRYKSLAYSLADVGYIDLWILRYLSLCLFVSSIITLVMCLILIWGLYSAHVFIFIATTMLVFISIGQFVVSILTFTSKYETRRTLLEQLPKLVITYRQGTDERARRALDFLHSSFRCCGSDGRLSFQNNVPNSCNMYSIGCLTRTMYFLDSCMDALAFVLLFFSLFKLLIVLFFYSYLCLYENSRNRRTENDENGAERSMDRQSPSLNSSSNEILRKKLLNDSERHQNDYVEPRPISRHEEDFLSPEQTYHIGSYYETEIVNSHAARKLSSISENTERTETDGSESDLHRSKLHSTKPRSIITPVQPPVQTRRRFRPYDDFEQDSGVEGSPSEKSFDGAHLYRKISEPSLYDDDHRSTSKSGPSLTFSKVFLTSVTDPMPEDRSYLQPKPILKKSIFSSAPRPTPRGTLKQDVTLV